MEKRALDVSLSPEESDDVSGGRITENEMGHTHIGISEANIYITGASSPNPGFLACFSWYEGEDVEKRWDVFAQQMWQWGLQPQEDEPAFSIVEGEVTYDHYYLSSVYDED